MDKCHARMVWKCEVLYAVLVKSAWKSSMASSTGTLQCDCDLHGKKNAEMNLPCLFPKSVEQRGQNSRCGGPIFESNIDQLEKRSALRQR